MTLKAEVKASCRTIISLMITHQSSLPTNKLPD